MHGRGGVVDRPIRWSGPVIRARADGRSTIIVGQHHLLRAQHPHRLRLLGGVGERLAGGR